MDADSSHRADSQSYADDLYNATSAGRLPECPISATKDPDPLVFSFINYQAGEGQNAESRKTVKSHVMRAWHRNKRVADTVKYARSQQRLESSASSHSGVANEADSKGLQSSKYRENELVGSTAPSPRLALPYLQGLIPYSYFAKGGPILYLRPSKWPFQRPFSMAGAEPKETFGRSVFPRQSIWMPDADIPDKVAMKGPLLGGDVLSWISHTPECFKYRAGTISWVQQQLETPSSATSDVTIGAIMTLTMWENGDGSSLDLTKHMDGLEGVVRLKGGINQIRQQIMARKLVIFDYIIAISCAREPRFPHYSAPQPHSPASDLSRDGISAQSPLYGMGRFDHIKCNWRSHDTAYILQTMWELTTQAIAAVPPSSSAQIDIQRHPRTLAPKICFKTIPRFVSSGRKPMQTSDEIHVFETLHHAALVYERAVSFPHVPFNSPTNHSDLRSLYESLNISAVDSFWLRYPGVLLWVLLVGCAVSVEREERSYFMMFIAKMGIFTEQRWWFETQSAILRFIEVQKLARKCPA